MDHWLSLEGIPAQGRDFLFSDLEFWNQAFARFGLEAEPVGPLEVDMHLLPQGEGCLVRGRLSGAVRVACDRCATSFEQPVEIEFEEFESLPVEGEESLEEARVRVVSGETELNVGALVWEQFVLALPAKPLCAEDCPGICPGCGRNLKTEKCECAQEQGDPRLAVLRNLKLS